MEARAQTGDRVRVQYIRLLANGAATQGRRGRQVLDFTVGSDEVISGVSNGVVGMAAGEEKWITLQPEEAYGNIHRRLIKEIPRRRFPASFNLRVGKRLASVGVTTGRRRLVQVVELKPESVVVDGNHPLAGKVLEVELQLVSLDSTS